MTRIVSYVYLILLSFIFKDILKIPEVDVINICTPNSSHYEIASESIKNGKHVLIEKPMTLNSKHAHELVKKAKNQNTTGER